MAQDHVRMLIRIRPKYSVAVVVVGYISIQALSDGILSLLCGENRFFGWLRGSGTLSAPDPMRGGCSTG